MYIYMTFRSFIMSSPILPTSLKETSYQYLAAWKKTSAGASRHHPSLYFGLQLFLQLLRLTNHQLTGELQELELLATINTRKTSVEPKNWWVCWCFSFSKRRIFSAFMLVFGTTVTNNLIPTRTADMNFGTCFYRIEPFQIPSGVVHNPWELTKSTSTTPNSRHCGVESCCQSSGNFSISGTIRRLTAPGLADGGTWPVGASRKLTLRKFTPPKTNMAGGWLENHHHLIGDASSHGCFFLCHFSFGDVTF